MTQVQEDKSELAKRIREAFADAPYPGDGNLIYAPDDLGAREIADAFRGKHWSEVPFETLLYHNDALHFFTDEAFRFYLPAYLLAVLERYEDADVLPEMLVGVLTAPDPQDPGYSSFRLRFDGFSADRRAAVTAFLEYLMMTHQDEYPDDELLTALQSYWTQHPA
jgi:hypothetical protein